MELGIEGKAAVVCAASKGLGFAVARRLSLEGARLAICARGGEALDEAAKKIGEESGKEVFAFPCDLSESTEIEGFMEAAAKRFGRVDILVNNAGGPPPGGFEDLTPEQWRSGFDLTLMSAMHLIRLVLPGMKAGGWGRILNMVSISAKQPLANMMLSNAIRAGVIGMAKTLADELGGSGVLVNSLLPGFMRTARMEEVIRAQAETRGISFDERLKEVQADIPLGRLGRPEEFADFAAFLVSERASFVTGGAFLCDGGMYRGIM